MNISFTLVVRWNSPWTTANSLCKLTGSHLSGEVTVDKMDLTNLPADGQSYWIGAVSIHTPWFDVFSKTIFYLMFKKLKLK